MRGSVKRKGEEALRGKKREARERRLGGTSRGKGVLWTEYTKNFAETPRRAEKNRNFAIWNKAFLVCKSCVYDGR